MRGPERNPNRGLLRYLEPAEHQHQSGDEDTDSGVSSGDDSDNDGGGGGGGDEDDGESDDDGSGGGGDGGDGGDGSDDDNNDVDSGEQALPGYGPFPVEGQIDPIVAPAVAVARRKRRVVNPRRCSNCHATGTRCARGGNSPCEKEPCKGGCSECHFDKRKNRWALTRYRAKII